MHEDTRRAAAADLPDVIALLEEGRRGIEEARGGALWLHREAVPGPLAAALPVLVEDPRWLVQIGAIDGVCLGVMLVEDDGPSCEPHLVTVRELFVTPEARGLGLGELMMDAVVDWATELGAVGIDGYALPGDRATKNFFETFGLVARGIVVHRGLG